MAGSLAWIYVYVTIPLAFGLFFVIRKVLPIFRRVFRKYDALNESVEENVSGIRVVKSFVREKFEMKKFDVAATDVQMDFTRAEKLLALNGPMMNLSVSVIFLCVIYFASQAIITSRGTLVNIGQFSSLFTYGFMILMSLMMFSMIFAMIAMSLESARRICEVLEATTTIHNPENPVTSVADGSIEFDDVSFSYNGSTERVALHDINLSIKSGETIGIIGGTGSGKTSLVNLIPGFYPATEGTIRLEGQDIRNIPAQELRRRVGVVPQRAVLFKGTVRSNLQWGKPDATDEELWQAIDTAQAREVVEGKEGKLDAEIAQNGKNLSGGQRQRLTIARALVRKPEILILDDSASALDYATDAKLRRALKEVEKETTTFIVSQRASTIRHADRIIVLDDGMIAGMGTHEQLLENCEVYQEIYYSQFEKKEKEA